MKKILIALLSVSIIMCLCACNSGSSSKSDDSSISESSKSESSYRESDNGKSEVPDNNAEASYVGTWVKTEIKTTLSSASETATAKIDLRSDGTFAMESADSDERGNAKSTMSGTYTVNGSEFSFSVSHLAVEGSLADGTQVNSEANMSESFSGKLGTDGKLTCEMAGVTTVVFEKI